MYNKGWLHYYSYHASGTARVLKRATPTTCMTRNIRLKWSSPTTVDTHTFCRVFSSGAVTTWFYDFGLSWLEFEQPTFRMRDVAFQRSEKPL